MPGLLAVVLRNVLENAVTYAPPGGRVSVRTTPAADGRWSLRVTNPCLGLSAADLPKVFEPFWRGDAARTADGSGRVGLGLALVQAYCGAMDVTVVATLVEPDRLELTLVFPPSRLPASDQGTRPPATDR